VRNLVLTEIQGDVAVVTLNRPERHNSLVPEILTDLLGGLESLRAHGEVHAVVLQANGRSFSTGGDVRAFFEHRADIEAYARNVVGLLNQSILALVGLPMPVVAAVHGIVTGGSLGLVLACDIVLVAPQVTLTPYYTTVGYSPDGGWTAMLPAAIGAKRAAEVLLVDRPITAQEAVEWGMASRVVAAEQVQPEALTTAHAIARQKAGSTERTKRLLWRDVPLLAARLENERQQFVQQIVTPEAWQGMEQFLQPRGKPA
jgi:enoyl-CoA hydratase/carnithine racemase